MFMKVHLPVGLPHNALLVPEEAVGTDQGEKFVFVVDGEDVVRQRRLKAGGLYFQKWRAVDSGLGPDDRIIVSGLQRVRPGLKVVPKPGEPASPPPSTPGTTWPTSSTAAASRPAPVGPADAPPPPPQPATAAAATEGIAAKKSAEH
jgi:hypothetical protein